MSNIDVSRLAGLFLNKLDPLDERITSALSNPQAVAQAHALVQELRLACEQAIANQPSREFREALGASPGRRTAMEIHEAEQRREGKRK